MSGADATAPPRFRPFGQLGLRARITATFTFGATLVAVLLSITSVTLSRSNLLEQRERLVEERTVINAAALSANLSQPKSDAQTLFGSLSTAGKPSALLRALPSGDAQLTSISLDPQYGTAAVPTAVRRRALAGRASIMRYEYKGEFLLVAAVPLAENHGAYFEINQLNDIEKSIKEMVNKKKGSKVVRYMVKAVYPEDDGGSKHPISKKYQTLLDTPEDKLTKKQREDKAAYDTEQKLVNRFEWEAVELKQQDDKWVDDKPINSGSGKIENNVK